MNDIYITCYTNFEGKSICTHYLLNPFKPNGIAYFHQLDQSINVLRVLRWNGIFHFIHILIKHSDAKKCTP